MQALLPARVCAPFGAALVTMGEDERRVALLALLGCDAVRGSLGALLPSIISTAEKHSTQPIDISPIVYVPGALESMEGAIAKMGAPAVDWVSRMYVALSQPEGRCACLRDFCEGNKFGDEEIRLLIEHLGATYDLGKFALKRYADAFRSAKARTTRS